MQLKVKGILSYPHLFQPRAVQQGDEPKYSASILIRKDDPQVAQIQQAVETEKANGFPSGFPANAKCAFKDGAVAYPEDPAMHNFYIISANAKADQRPALVDASLQPVVNPSDVYAGAVAWCAINFFSYSKQISKGVGCGLNGVMLTGEEGELGRLDGRPTVEQMFGGVGGAPTAAPQAAAPAPVAPQAPAPAAPVPQPPQPPAAPPAAPQYQMTAAANGVTREAYHAAGWTDELLITNGLMLPPGGVMPSFAQ